MRNMTPLSNSTTISTGDLTTTTSSVLVYTKNKLTSSDIVLITIYVNIFLFGLIGNVLVIQYFGFRRKKILLYHTYLIHLAIADLISSTVTPIHFIYSVVSANIWHLGPFPCKLISLIGPLTVNVSAWLLTSIAHERYRGIVTPFKPRWTKFRIHVIVFVIWFVSVITLIPYINASQLSDGLYCIPQWSDKVYELLSASLILLLQSMLPIVFMIFTVSRILFVLRNRMALFASSQTNNKLEINNNLLNDNQKPSTSFSTTNSRQDVNIENSLTSVGSTTTKQLSRSSFSIFHQPSNIRRGSNLNKLKVEKTLLPLKKKRSSNGYELLKRKKYSKTISKNNPLRVVESPLQNLINESSFKKRHSQVSFQLSPRKYNLSPSSENESNVDLAQLLSNKSMSLDTGMNVLISRKKEKVIHASFRKKASAPVNRRKSIYRTMRKFMSIEKKRAKKRGKAQRERIFMLIVTFSVFVVCSLPYNLFYVVSIVLIEFFQQYSKIQLLSNMNFWLSTLVVANSITNCAIYAGMDKGFRSYCFGLIKRTKWRELVTPSSKKPKLRRNVIKRKLTSSTFR